MSLTFQHDERRHQRTDGIFAKSLLFFFFQNKRVLLPLRKASLRDLLLISVKSQPHTREGFVGAVIAFLSLSLARPSSSSSPNFDDDAQRRRRCWFHDTAGERRRRDRDDDAKNTPPLSLSLSLSLSKQVVLFSLMEENALKKPFFRLFGRQQSSSSSRLFEENNTPRANKHTLSLSLSLSL